MVEEKNHIETELKVISRINGQNKWQNKWGRINENKWGQGTLKRN